MGEFIQPSSVNLFGATLSSIKESKTKKTGNVPMLSVKLLKPQQSWSPGPCIRYQNGSSLMGGPSS